MATIPNLTQMMEQYITVQCRYQAALREMRTKLEILDEEFQLRNKRNPIHAMLSRMKTLPSIIDKLQRKNLPISLDSATKELGDIAGMRVICSYLDDIYTLYDLLAAQDDILIKETRDYIKAPKANGYRSLHMLLEIPVHLAEGKVYVPVEIQIRTIAMDFWASLEHQLRYKEPDAVPKHLNEDLLKCAEDIAAIDLKMQAIYDTVAKLTK
jgi:Uncharacterized protein conserved in bacteria